MPDYWPACGYRLLESQVDGLRLTDAFLKSLFLRPEVAPIAASCAAEVSLHESLMAEPRRAVGAAELLAIRDPDTQANYRVLLRFRDRLLAAPTLEAAYVELFRGAGVDVPPLFVFQLTQIFLRHILGEGADPLAARAAECLFRVQKVAIQPDGTVLVADEETVERLAEPQGFDSLGELLHRQGMPERAVDLDVLRPENAADYWGRDECFDFALSLSPGHGGIEALVRVLEAWIRHFLAIEVDIRPAGEIPEGEWAWHVGLDAEASGILNDLYNGKPVEEDRLARLLCLFELRFRNPADMRPALADRPVWLAIAMDAEHRLKLKPQNLLLNLPLSRG
ncbi:MAG: DUF6352 family protein [Casimicrobiaceae bacterium]